VLFAGVAVSAGVVVFAGAVAFTGAVLFRHPGILPKRVLLRRSSPDPRHSIP
jgi:hypothetical protein